MFNLPLNRLEQRSIVALSGIYGLRMFGLFLILPVLAIYAEQLRNATPLTMGIALGIYGITQAVFQIPFGLLSDRFGRKPMIVAGLLIFILGSLIAAAADSITGVICGRALQGAGAIAAVVLALASDLTRESQRSKAMAAIGMTIGASFLLALMLAPFLQRFIGVQGLFLTTAALAAIAILVVWKAVPDPVQGHHLDVKAVPATMWRLLHDAHLMRLNYGIFMLHFVLMSLFVAIPMYLQEQLDLPSYDHWRIYLPSVLGSIVFLIPLILWSSRSRNYKPVLLTAISAMLLAQVVLLFSPKEITVIIVCLLLFFIGFNYLEAVLPSLVSRRAPAACRGSAMGIYNSFQFMGIFFGGIGGGLVYGNFGIVAVFLCAAIVLLLWFLLVYRAEQFRLLDSLTVRIDRNAGVNCTLALEEIKGVYEVIIVEGESVAYLKVDKNELDSVALEEIVVVN